VSPETFAYVVRPVEYSSRLVLKDFSLSMSMQEFFQSIIQRRVSPKITSLSPAQQSEFFRQAINDLTQAVKEETLVEVNLQETVMQTLYDIINRQLQRIPERLRPFAVIAWGVFLFLFLTGFLFIFSWLISFAAWLLYQLLLANNFIKIGYREKQVEGIII
jgi:hypothetical protein